MEPCSVEASCPVPSCPVPSCPAPTPSTTEASCPVPSCPVDASCPASTAEASCPVVLQQPHTLQRHHAAVAGTFLACLASCLANTLCNSRRMNDRAKQNLRRLPPRLIREPIALGKTCVMRIRVLAYAHTHAHTHTHIHAYIMDRPSNASDLSINSQQHLSTIIPSIKDHPNNILAQGCSAHARIFLKLLPSHPCSEHSQIPLHIE